MAEPPQEPRELRRELLDLVTKHDPVGLTPLAPPDEYDLEVDSILPRLRTARSVADVQSILYEEFVRWFSVETVPARDWFEALAAEVWEAYCRAQASGPPVA